MAGNKLRIPQVRVLTALAGGGLLNRPSLGEAAGYTAISGTITRALAGLREGSSSGPAHPGLLELGYIEEINIELDGGVHELCYRITPAGKAALAALGKVDLTQTRDKASCVNDRYKGVV